VEHEANVILVTGVLCVMVAVLGFLAAANSFTLSKKHFYYHHANQLFNLVQVLVSAALLITSAVLSKYQDYYKVDLIFRDWPVLTNQLLACLSIVLTFLSWFSIKQEHFTLMRPTTSLNLLVMLAIGCISCQIYQDANQYEQSFDCLQAMQ